MRSKTFIHNLCILIQVRECIGFSSSRFCIVIYITKLAFTSRIRLISIHTATINTSLYPQKRQMQCFTQLSNVLLVVEI